VTWLAAFLITLAVEVPIVALLLRRHLGLAQAAAIAVLAQIATHPALWFLVPQFDPYLLWVAVAESGVVLVESAIFATALHRSGADRWIARGFLVALVANLITTTIGLAML
jgi:hypothetical protein